MKDFFLGEINNGRNQNECKNNPACSKQPDPGEKDHIDNSCNESSCNHYKDCVGCAILLFDHRAKDEYVHHIPEQMIPIRMPKDMADATNICQRV